MIEKQKMLKTFVRVPHPTLIVSKVTSRLQNEAGVDTNGKDACGVGLVAAIDGKPSRPVVEAGIEALKALWHRGAVDADGMTGDGAGIMVEIPQDFFRDHVARTGHTASESPIAVGMSFCRAQT